jgi:hypothetical protein
MEEEARGRPFDEGEMKGVGRQFGSAPSGCGRTAHGGAWHGGAPGEAVAARRPKVGEDPGWANLGCAGQVATSPKGLFVLKMREKGKWVA